MLKQEDSHRSSNCIFTQPKPRMRCSKLHQSKPTSILSSGSPTYHYSMRPLSPPSQAALLHPHLNCMFAPNEKPFSNYISFLYRQQSVPSRLRAPHNQIRSTKINVNKSAERGGFSFSTEPNFWFVLIATNVGCVLKSMKIKSITFRLLSEKVFFLPAKKGGKRAKFFELDKREREKRRERKENSSHFPGTLKTDFSRPPHVTIRRRKQ